MELDESIELEQLECIELKELELEPLKPWELELGSTTRFLPCEADLRRRLLVHPRQEILLLVILLFLDQYR